MGIRFNETPDSGECISCMKCMSQACKFDAISLDIAGYSFSRDIVRPEKKTA
jgi:ferredoxin